MLNFFSFRLSTILLSFFFVLITIIGCDIINEPYQKEINQGIIDTTRPKILIEYFTAHKCNNCPAGANQYKSLQAYYPEKIIVIAIHGGSLAIPEPDNADGSYSYDFRSSIGNNLFAVFSPEAVGLPCGMISRNIYNTKKVMEYPYWSDAITDY